MIVAEETCNGELSPDPLPSKEGLIGILFEEGHVFFDDGKNHPNLDWKRLDFQEPLRQAREGGARFLIACRVESRRQEVPDSPARIDASGRFYLLDAGTDRVLLQGEVLLDNAGREKDLPYEKLLVLLGEKLGRELLRLWSGRTDKL